MIAKHIATCNHFLIAHPKAKRKVKITKNPLSL